MRTVAEKEKTIGNNNLSRKTPSKVAELEIGRGVPSQLFTDESKLFHASGTTNNR
jgi:hypothetical protein